MPGWAFVDVCHLRVVGEGATKAPVQVDVGLRRPGCSRMKLKTATKSAFESF